MGKKRLLGYSYEKSQHDIQRRTSGGYQAPIQAKPDVHRTLGTSRHAREHSSQHALLLTHLTVGRKRSISHGWVHHSFLLNEKHAFLVLAQVCPGSLQLRWRRRRLLLGRLRLLRLRLGRLLLLDVGHQGCFVGVGHRGCHSRTQVRIKMRQRLSVAVGENIVLFV